VRIISGQFKGFPLESPKGLSTRPTSDKVKEALFSMLMPYLPAQNVLDLFAGTGALGLESISRGCGRATFVDNDPKAIAAIKRNIGFTKTYDCTKIFKMDAVTFLDKTDEKFDIIFMDPPYEKKIYEQCLMKIYENSLLNEGGIITLEWDEKVNVPQIPDFYEVIKDKKYGRVNITILKFANQ